MEVTFMAKSDQKPCSQSRHFPVVYPISFRMRKVASTGARIASAVLEEPQSRKKLRR